MEPEGRVRMKASGLCRLAQQEGCASIVPQMCQFDFISADFIGAELTRTKTLAGGDDCCNFRYRKKAPLPLQSILSLFPAPNHLIIVAFLLEQLCMGPHFLNTSMIQQDNMIGVLDCVQPVCNNKYGLAFHQMV